MTKGRQSSQSLPDDDLRNALRPWWEAGATFEMLRLHTTDGYIAAASLTKGRKRKEVPILLLGTFPLARNQTKPSFLWKAQISGKEAWQQCDWLVFCPRDSEGRQ